MCFTADEFCEVLFLGQQRLWWLAEEICHRTFFPPLGATTDFLLQSFRGEKGNLGTFCLEGNEILLTLCSKISIKMAKNELSAKFDFFPCYYFHYGDAKCKIKCLINVTKTFFSFSQLSA